MYDKEKVYDEKIEPLMTEIISICAKHDIKMFASYYLKEQTADSDDMYCTTLLNDGENESKSLDCLYNIIVNGYTAQKPFFMAATITKK